LGTKDSIKDTKDASMADARQSHDKSKKTSTQGASSMMVNQVKSQKTINVKCFIILSKTTLTLLWFFDALLRQVMPCKAC